VWDERVEAALGPVVAEFGIFHVVWCRALPCGLGCDVIVIHFIAALLIVNAFLSPPL